MEVGRRGRHGRRGADVGREKGVRPRRREEEREVRQVESEAGAGRGAGGQRDRADVREEGEDGDGRGVVGPDGSFFILTDDRCAFF